MRRSGLLLLFSLALPAQVLEVSSSALSEGAEQVAGKRVHMTGEIRQLAGARLAGPAVTIRLVRDEAASASKAGLAAIRVLESAPAGSVIVAARRRLLTTRSLVLPSSRLPKRINCRAS